MKIPPNKFSFKTKEEAELVLKYMKDIVKSCEIVSVADLNELVGLPTTAEDNLVGWNDLNNVKIKKSHKKYSIDFPPIEPFT